MAPPGLEQHSPRRGSRLHDRRRAIGEERHQLRGIRRRLPTRDNHLGAAHERQEQLEARDVEREGGKRHEHVAFDDLERPPELREHVRERAMGDLHPLRSAGRA